jgi:hypothetical protein
MAVVMAAASAMAGVVMDGKLKICHLKIAELSGKAEMLIRTEGCAKYSQGQRIGGEKI